MNPWFITHWALAQVKGIREPHEVKKKSFDLGGNRTHDVRIRSTITLPTELQGRTEKVMGSISTLVYTLELILCSTICKESYALEWKVYESKRNGIKHFLHITVSVFLKYDERLT